MGFFICIAFLNYLGQEKHISWKKEKSCWEVCFCPKVQHFQHVSMCCVLVSVSQNFEILQHSTSPTMKDNQKSKWALFRLLFSSNLNFFHGLLDTLFLVGRDWKLGLIVMSILMLSPSQKRHPLAIDVSLLLFCQLAMVLRAAIGHANKK